MKNHLDWTCFSKCISINKPIKEVYDAWAIPVQVSTWFLEKAEYTAKDGKPRRPDDHIQEGDIQQWKWNNWDFIEEGKVLKANGRDQVSFTFGDAGNVHILLNEATALLSFP